MAYQTEAFAKLTGVSARTLRYYHERGLLVPQLAENGYREYTSADADRLQLILLYRSLEFTLTEIEKLLTLPHEQLLKTLEHQRVVLQQRQAELATNLAKLDATLANQKGELTMTDQAKFEQFKQDAIKENDRQYGAEVIDNYGAKAKQQADHHFGNLTETQYQSMQDAETTLAKKLATYIAEPALPSEAAKQAFHAHQTWLKLAAPNYSEAYHRGVADLYVADERFGQYYEKLVHNPKAAQSLRDIVYYYTEK